MNLGGESGAGECSPGGLTSRADLAFTISWKVENETRCNKQGLWATQKAKKLMRGPTEKLKKSL